MRIPIPLSLIIAAGTVYFGCSSKASLTSRPDSATGTSDSGGQIGTTGGTMGPKMDGSAGGTSGTGGVLASGGAPSTGGSPGSGGAPSTGGVAGTGGKGSLDGAAASDTSSVQTGCSCSSGVLSWDCFCSAYTCSAKLTNYQPDGGLPTNVRAIREYADCNLVVVTYQVGYDPEISRVFDLRTGALVGDEKAGDVPMNCPFGDGSTVSKLSAGVFPGSDCKVTKCTVGPVGGPYCVSKGSIDAGGS